MKHLSVLLLLCSVPVLADTPWSALVTSVQGTVTGPGGKPLRALSRVTAGDEVKLDAGASLSLAFIHGGTRVRLTGPTSAKVGPDGVDAPGAQVQKSQEYQPVAMPDGANLDRLAGMSLSGVRSAPSLDAGPRLQQAVSPGGGGHAGGFGALPTPVLAFAGVPQLPAGSGSHVVSIVDSKQHRNEMKVTAASGYVELPFLKAGQPYVVDLDEGTWVVYRMNARQAAAVRGGVDRLQKGLETGDMETAALESAALEECHCHVLAFQTLQRFPAAKALQEGVAADLKSLSVAARKTHDSLP